MEDSLFPTHLHHFGHKLSIRTPFDPLFTATEPEEKDLQLSCLSFSAKRHPSDRMDELPIGWNYMSHPSDRHGPATERMDLSDLPKSFLMLI